MRETGRLTVINLLRTLRFHALFYFSLAVLVNEDILQFQLFAVQNIVDRAEHHQKAFQRQADDALHSADEVRNFFFRYIELKSQLPE